MENKIKRNKVKSKKERLSGLMLMVAILGIMVLPIAVQADSLNPGVLSVDSPHYGSTYGEWSKVWWQWALSQPLPQNPLVDDTGVNAANGQQGPVWFLGGKYCAAVIPANPTCTPVATADRTVTVPAGKALFFPILNGEADNLGSPKTYNETELRTFAKENMDLGENMVAEIDGIPISGLGSALTTQYRVTSQAFNYHIPDNNIYSLFGFDFPKQTVKGAVADGVFLMLAPLSVGQHKIHFAGKTVQNGATLFALDINYTINVVKIKLKEN